MRAIITFFLLLVSCYPVSSGQTKKRSTQSGKTLEIVKQRGRIICGVNAHLPGFGYLSPKGNYEGFDIDFCRALAAGIFGDKNKVEFRPLQSKERFTALQTGEVDVLIRNTTWTLTRETELGLNFAPVTFYDGQAMMVRTNSKIKELKQLKGASIGVTSGTTTELNLADVMASLKISYTPIVFESTDELFDAFAHDRVDAVTGDRSTLIARRLALHNPHEYTILSSILSKEPLAPAVRQGDEQWRDIVTWIVFATMAGDEFGVSQKNVNQVIENTTDPKILKLLGKEGHMGTYLGLTNSWAYDVIHQVGNYSDIYFRNFGSEGSLAKHPGYNQVYTKGGLLYSPPFR